MGRTGPLAERRGALAEHVATLPRWGDVMRLRATLGRVPFHLCGRGHSSEVGRGGRADCERV